jgi:hypothetical protein
MRKDVEKVWKPVQRELFLNQTRIETEALALYRKNPSGAVSFLTRYSMDRGNDAVRKCWNLGDFLWTKYDEKF